MDQTKKIKTQFGPEIRFPVLPSPALPFRAVQTTALEGLKGRLLCQAIQEAADVDLYAPLRQAANEAAALAWATQYPLLLFPLLFEEKAEIAIRQVAV